MDLITIIVPVYNTEKLLTKCLNSIINQTYYNLEIILIDDGSLDKSGEICEKFKEEDARIIVIHKKNGGQGSARNMGIKQANGKYIAFVDSDDWIEETMYENLYNNIKNFDADIACCCNNLREDMSKGQKKVYKFPTYMKEHAKNYPGLGHSPCDKLFKKNLFDNIYFSETRAYEDCSTIYKLFYNAKKIILENTDYYHYEYRENSTMNQYFSKMKFYAVQAYFEMYKFYLEFIPQYEDIVKVNLMGSIQYFIGECFKNKKIKEYAKEYYITLEIVKELTYDNINFKRRIILFFLKNYPYIYGLIYKIVK